MRASTIWKLVAFNLGIIALEIVLFSPGVLHIVSRFGTGVGVVVGILSAILFIGVNYWLLSSGDKPISVKSTKLDDAQDFREALQSWKSPRNPFNNELNEATGQIDLFFQKQKALKELLGDQAKEPGNPFLSMSEDVQDCLFSNMKKIINRMTILNLNEPSRFPMHNEFIRSVLNQNDQLLTQYDNLIIEISQIGDTANMDNLHLENITEALHELRGGTPMTEVSQQLQQDMQD